MDLRTGWGKTRIRIKFAFIECIAIIIGNEVNMCQQECPLQAYDFVICSDFCSRISGKLRLLRMATARQYSKFNDSKGAKPRKDKADCLERIALKLKHDYNILRFNHGMEFTLKINRDIFLMRNLWWMLQKSQQRMNEENRRNLRKERECKCSGNQKRNS